MQNLNFITANLKNWIKDFQNSHVVIETKFLF